MTRAPSPSALHRQLQDIVKRLENYEAVLKELGVRVDVLDRWHQDTEFAKRLLKEYQEEHPEIQPNTISNSINGKAWLAVLAALGALTAVVLALSKLIK